MTVLTYTKIPDKTKWLADSSVTFANRGADVTLSYIDFLVEALTLREDLQFTMLPNLYFALDYWLKMQPTTGTMAKGRRPAILALYTRVAHDMCDLMNCKINSLPRELELMFGREVTKDGSITDYRHGRARFMDKAEAERYRVHWKDRKAYQYSWWDKTGSTKLKEMNSSNGFSTIARGKTGDRAESIEGFAPFILTMSRTFYSTKHDVGNTHKDRFGRIVGNHDGIFHSSYFNGTVAGAGTMLVENGEVRKIRNDSGHYRPGDINMLQVLQALQMVGVLMSQIEVIDWTGKVVTPALRFMGDTMTREKFRRSHADALSSAKNAYAEKPRSGNLSDAGKFRDPNASVFPTGTAPTGFQRPTI